MKTQENLKQVGEWSGAAQQLGNNALWGTGLVPPPRSVVVR